MKSIRTLIEFLNENTKYYNEGKPHISDKDWDNLYFQLAELEKKTGIIYPDSPTQSISYETVSKLIKKEHNHKMLSLEKTKEVEDIVSFFGNKPFVAMCKMDGLTCSLTYKNGELVSAETRGNGLIGDDILHNARVIPSIPQYIPHKEEIIIDGEIISTYENFEYFNNDYKNPRNFAAGSIRLLDANECAKRGLTFVAWDIVTPISSSLGGEIWHCQKLEMLSDIFGFTTVPFALSSKADKCPVETIVDYLKATAQRLGYPIDGIVFKFDDCAYGRSLGETAHHFKNAIAYKFYDETYETELINIEWTIGRTGVLTPTAVFHPVEIDGCEIERASLHNLTILEETLHGPGWLGQKVEIFRSNMIIPQIYSAEIDNEYTKYYFDYPHICPICSKPTVIKQDNDSQFVVCSNPNCEGKLINKLNYFVGKKGLDIKGLSQATLTKLLEWGWINSFADIYELHQYRSEWIKKPGFGPKSVDNILEAISASKKQPLDKFIASLGIPLIGTSMTKELVKHIESYQDFRDKIKNGFDFSEIDGFAEAKNNAIHNFNYDEADEVVKYINFEEPKEKENGKILANLVFVITGRVELVKNRTELQNIITSNGGKVVSAISSNVNYLINNDIESTSSKNLAAKKLGIPVISEKYFFENILKKY
jgi:DNA ligase (NAD+)